MHGKKNAPGEGREKWGLRKKAIREGKMGGRGKKKKNEKKKLSESKTEAQVRKFKGGVQGALQSRSE